MFKKSLAVAAILFFSVTAQANEKIAWQERTLGKKDAPVEIIEYASLGCNHCANFHATTFQELKKEYIDTGKVKFTFRDFPLEIMSLKASMLARCMPEKKFFPFIALLFDNQMLWLDMKGDLTKLKRMAKLAGMNDTQVDTCLDNKDLENAILAKRLEAGNTLKVASTPTFFIGKEKIDGEVSMERLKKYLK